MAETSFQKERYNIRKRAKTSEQFKANQSIVVWTDASETLLRIQTKQNETKTKKNRKTNQTISKLNNVKLGYILKV